MLLPSVMAVAVTLAFLAWDRLFGTYRDTLEFTPRCGFPGNAEQRIGEMLVFRDVYQAGST